MPAPRRLPAKSRTQHSVLRRRGTLAAVALAVIFAAALGTLIIQGILNPKRPLSEGEQQAGRRLTMPSNASPEPQLAGPMERVRIDLLDRNDRTIRLGELYIDRAEPLDGKNYRVEIPRAWVYLDDGQFIHVRADSGRFYMPDQTSEPESGWLTGNVIARLFEAQPDDVRPDPERTPPRATMRTDSLFFNRMLGEVSTPDEVVVWAPELDARFDGLAAVLNESRQRLERLETMSDGLVVYRPGMREPAKPPPVQAARSTAPREPSEARPQPATPRPPPRAPLETMYAIAMQEDVVLKQQGRRISADTLRGWLRLIDSALPANAIAPIRLAGSSPGTEVQPAAAMGTSVGATRAEGPRESTRVQPQPARAAPEGKVQAIGANTGERAASENAEDEIRLTWTGRGLIVPLDAPPDELATNHVALRFTADGAGEVVFSDESTGARGIMPRLDYLATTRRMHFLGPVADSVRLTLPDSARIETGDMQSDLGTGFIQVRGPVTVLPVGDGATESFRISAAEAASFMLIQRGGAITSELQQAIFHGDVRMESDDGVATGGFARADFVTTPERANNLVSLILEEGASMISARDERLRGERIGITFRPGTLRSQPVPVRLIATGDVVGARDQQVVAADSLEADLSQREGGPVEVTGAVARGSVRFFDAADQVGATSDVLEYKPVFGEAPRAGLVAQVVDLTGEQVVITRAGESQITGTSIRIDGAGRTMHVLGAGEFEHSDGEAHLHATWSEGMWVDDVSGRIECSGNAVANSTPDPLTRDSISAQRINLWLTPAGPAGAAPPDGAGELPRRELLRAEAIGDEVPGGSRAAMDSRRFIEDPAVESGRKLIQLSYLEGRRIIADNREGTLVVPSEGRMVLLDHREEPAAPADPLSRVQAANAQGFSAFSGRGSALIDWLGSLRTDRAMGDIHIERGVQVTHLRLEDGEVTDISCDTLTVRTVSEEASTSLLSGTQLSSAHARGAVRVASGPAALPGAAAPARRELTADQVEYDALRGQVSASAAAGNTVTLTDPQSPTAIMAQSLWWDLIRNNVRVIQPVPATVPR